MASPTAAPGKYPEQLVIMVSAETKTRIESDARKHELSKSEVARTYLDAGIERADELVGERSAELATSAAAELAGA